MEKIFTKSIVKKKFLLLVMICFISVSAFAQQRVSGVVTGTANNEALPGVNIHIKGTSVGTITDIDGRYSLDVPNNNDVLVFSFIGFTRQEVPVNGRSVIDISLAEDVQSLNEVVVVGYGSQRKSDLTGSISSVSGEEITMLPTQRVDQALQGRAAGVMVMNTDGAPGGNTTIRIRGMNSINGGNNALVVIDGLQGADLNSINPHDIASIEVLKDASATAIYGSQGANGVILITTKLGKTEKPMIDYKYDIGFASPTKLFDLMNAAEYARNINAVEMSRNGDGNVPIPIFSEAEIAEFERTGGTDWQDEIYRTAKTQNHQLSIGGKTDKLNYLISGGFLDQEGILINTSHQRYTLRANVRADITDWAKFGVNWAGSKEITNSALFGGDTDWPNNPIGTATKFAPTIPVYDENGNYSRASLFYGSPVIWNPVASALEPLIERNTTRNNINSYLEFNPLEGLTLRITGGARITEGNNMQFLNNKTFVGLQNNGQGRTSSSSNTFLQNSNILTYDKKIDEHHFTVTAVAEQQYSKYEGNWINTSDFLNHETGAYDLGGANDVKPGSSFSERVINSYLGRINYILADKYLLTASYRADGSSVFGANNKWGYFPSASIAWRASDETFIKDLELFSDLKFRVSWGVTGNQAINPYQTLARISSGGYYPYNGTDGTDIGFYISAAANPSLRWESTEQTNFGMDLAIFDGRLTVTADYYEKTTNDLLMPRELPLHTGLSSVIDNVGSMGNKGFELALGGDPFIGNFSWNTGFNISFNRTTVLDLGPIDKMAFSAGGSGSGTNLPFMYLEVGQPLGNMMGWGYEGTWKENEAEQAAMYGQLPGDPHYTDLNEDGKINIDDQMVIGNSMPKFIFGWNNRVSYKGFDLMFQIQGKQGNDVFNIARIERENSGSGTSKALLNRWTPDNQDSDIPALIDGKTREEANLVSTISFPTSSGNTNSRWVEDGSYIRLKNITMGYNLPKFITNKMQLNNLRVYISATNLLTLTEYSGYDPEVSSYTNNDAQIGTDFNNYPQSKVFNLGLNVSF
jgi:TonB-linked SusC/RagA family outer membrane protein